MQHNEELLARGEQFFDNIIQLVQQSRLQWKDSLNVIAKKQSIESNINLH